MDDLLQSPVPSGFRCSRSSCANPPLMPPGGWPPPGTPDAAKLLCERHLTEWRAVANASDVKSIMDSARAGVAGGIVAIIVGIIFLTYLSQDYSACQSILGSADSQCQTVTLFHWGGIALVIVGAAIIAGAIVSANRK